MAGSRGRELVCGPRPHRRCWTSRPDLGERWPYRLVATAAEDRLKLFSDSPSQCSRRSRALKRGNRGHVLINSQIAAPAFYRASHIVCPKNDATSMPRALKRGDLGLVLINVPQVKRSRGQVQYR
jgi:hypothetical protein